jgi:transposase, IS5 family
MKQLSLASLTYASTKKQTKREKFLHEMDQVVPWARLINLIEPHYPKAGKGRTPMPLEVMLRIYCLQQWYGLSDPAAEESLYDIESMCRFAGLELGEDASPDETTILKFRHLLEKHLLTDALFVEIKAHLQDQGLLLGGGSIVDATIIHAPSSTKNQDKQRDPEMSSTKKGNTWHFGMKAHISVDAKSGLVHAVGVTTVITHDTKVIDQLIRENDEAIFGDKGMSTKNSKPPRVRPVPIGPYWKKPNRRKSSHPHSVNGIKNTPRFGPKLSMYSESSNVSLVIVRPAIEALKKTALKSFL